MLLSFYLIVCQFQPGVAYKSIAYKKACILLSSFERRLEKEQCVIVFKVNYICEGSSLNLERRVEHLPIDIGFI